MAFYADLHVHSKYSRATSRDCDLEHLAWWARRKGISVVATGDFTHPAWFDELREKLVPAEPGLFRLAPEIEREVERNLPPACRGPLRFLLEVEISTIYKKGEKTRKVHHLIYAGSFATAARFRERLGQIGNLASDGRPILGLDSRHLLEITLEAGDDAYLVPAHIWTPWFSALGSKSGFDSVTECYGDLAGHLFAVETGLSSDPPMNWRVSALDRYTLVSNSDAHSPPMLGREACAFDCDLDYFAIRRALESGEGYRGTVEFFPEEGKYHLDGHRACGVRLEPEETRRHQGRCPTCGKPVTVGVMHRVEALADRAEAIPPAGAAAYRCLVPLPEVVGEIWEVGPRSKRVEGTVAGLVSRLGPELEILERTAVEEVERSGGELLAEALRRLRAGRVRREAGYDGEFGVIRLFEPGEIGARGPGVSLFGPDFGGGAARRGGGRGEGEDDGEGKVADERDREPPRRAGGPATAEPSGNAGTRRWAEGDEGAETGAAEVAPQLGPGAGVRATFRPDTGELSGAAGASAASEPAAAEPAPAHVLAAALPPPAGPTQLPLLGVASVLAALDPEQRAAAAVTAGPLLVVAGPGTGKTRTLTHRLAHLVAEAGVAPERCLAVTFTRRAAAEMRERLAALLGRRADAIVVTTFHGLGAAIVREHQAALGLPGDFRVADAARCAELAAAAWGRPAREAAQLLAELGRRRREPIEAAGLARPGRPEPGIEAAGLARSTPPADEPRAKDLPVAAAPPAAEPPLPAEPIEAAGLARPTAAAADLAAAYEEALRRRGLVDFDDLLGLPVGLFDARPDLRDRYRERFVHLSIDEYQDVDALQYRLVRQLAPPGANLCAIGDPDQSIYGFRGADVGFFLRFTADYPGTHVVHLHRNYRSSRVIVGAALSVIRPASLAGEDRRLEAMLPLPPERIVVAEAADEAEEAEGVARAIEELLGGTSYYSLDSGRVGGDAGRDLSFGDFAVLYRTAAQAAPVAEALGRAGIPFQERTHEPLASRPGVAALVRALREEETEEAAPARSVESRLRRTAERLRGSGEAGTAAATLAAAAEVLAPLATRSGDDRERFLAEVALGAEVDTLDPRAERVALLTLHAAKGLEFPVVFVVGCDDGLLPLVWPGGEAAADPGEERRLFFVGVTRAQALLYLTRARRRRLWGAERETRPSPFLADIEEALLAHRRGPRAERPPGPRQLRLL
jgi:ATP-dependent DNA helicase UvrD/PcrA